MEDDVNLYACIQSMKNKWLEYFKIISPIYFACVFYPRCKLDGLHEYLSTYYEILKLDVNFMLYLMKLRKKFMPYLMNKIEFIVQVLISPSWRN